MTKLGKKGKTVFSYQYKFSPSELKQMPTWNGIKMIDCAPTAFNLRSYFDRLLRKLKLRKAKIYSNTRFGFLGKKSVGVMTLIKRDDSANAKST